MSQPYIIPTRFTAIDGISPVVRSMSYNITDMATKLNSHVARQERLFRRFTPGLGSATKQLLAYGSASAMLAGMGATGKAIMDNQTSMQSLSAVTGVVGDDFTRMRREADALAHDMKRSSTEIAGSFEVVGSMMSEYLGDPKALRAITKEGIILAKASRDEMVPALENLTSIMNQFDLKANQAKKAVNILTAGEIVGSLRTKQVTEALQEFGAGAYAANIDLAESVALTEALAKQMKTDKIGVGARNILTVMDSATGLSRKARKELRGAGVDMHFLMDKTKTLSERLHELSKLSGNEKAITKVFGRENKTAAQVIFNQLGVYDQYLAKIRTTEEAEKQAAINSATLANAVTELKNEWINMWVAQDRATLGLGMATSTIKFLTNNLDTLVGVGVTYAGTMLLWKGYITGAKIAATGLNIALGIKTAFTTANTVALEGNTVATIANNVALRAQASWIALSSGNMRAFAHTLGLTPWSLAIAGAAALAGGLYLVYRREQQLVQLYREKMRLDTAKNIKEEAAEVDNLAKKYYLLGNSIQKANAMAVAEKKMKIDTERGKTEKNISSLKAQLAAENNKIYLGDLFTGAFGEGRANYGARSSLSNQLLSQQSKARGLAEDNSFITQYARNGIDAGMINKKDLGGLFNSKVSKPPVGGTIPQYNYMSGDKKEEPFFDYEKMRAMMYEREQKITVEFKNAPAGTTVSSSGGLNTPSSY